MPHVQCFVLIVQVHVKLPHFILIGHLSVELALDALNHNVAVTKNFCTHLIHIFLAIGPKLSHLNPLNLHVCVAQEDLIFVGLIAGSTLCQDDLVSLPHQVIVLLSKGISHLILEPFYLINRRVVSDHLYTCLSKLLT